MPRWLRWAAVGGAVLAVLLAIVVHTPPFRRAVLRRVVVTLADRFDIALRADTLRYDLIAPRVVLTGVSVAATRSPNEPFLTADLLEIRVPRSALFGAFAIDRLHLENGRLHIARGADGTTNLPKAGAGEPGEPQAVRIGRLSIPRLAVTLSDAAQQLSLTLPNVAVDVGSNSGTIAVAAPGRVERHGVVTTVSEFGGGVAFDGRVVHLSDFAAAIEQGRVALNGTLAVLVREPRADLRVSGTTDVAALARWLGEVSPVTGTLAVDGTVAGPLTDPGIELRVRSDTLQWQNLQAANLDAGVVIDPARVRITRASAVIAGGPVSVDGEFSRPDGEIRLAAAWSEIELDRLVRAIDASATVRPAGRMSGSGTVSGSGARIGDWTIDARARVTDDGRGGLAVPGTSTLRVDDGRWRLAADHVVEGVPVRARIGGRLVPERLAASTVTGDVVIDEVEVDRVLVALRRAGVADLDTQLARGVRARADVRLTGTLAAPHAAFDARVRHGEGNRAAAVGTAFIDRGRLDMHVSAQLAKPSMLLTDVPFEGNIEAELDVRGPFSRLEANGTIAARDVVYDRFHLGRIDAVVGANTDRVVADLAIPELSARARTALALATPRTATVDLQVEDADLARLVRDAQIAVPIGGTVSLSARAAGPVADWQRGSVTVDLLRLDARVADLPVRLAGPGRLSYDAEAFDVASLEADLGSLRLSVAGRLAATAAAPSIPASEALRALLVGDVADVAAALHAAGVADLPDVQGRGQLALVGRVTGSADAPAVAADLDVSEGEVAFANLPPVRGVTIRAHVAEGWIEPLVVSGEWQQSRVAATGRIPLRLFQEYLPADVVAALPETARPATLTARAESITPAVLAPFLDPEALSQIAGAIDASVQLEAATLAPEATRGEARLDRLDIRVAGLPVGQREPTRIVFDDGVARVAAWDWAGQGATLGVQGEVRLADGHAAILSAGRFDVRLLTPFVRESGLTLSGTLAPRLSVAGPITDPRLDGEIALEGAEVRLRDPRIVATNLSAFGVLTPSEMRLTTLSGVVNGGTLTGTGTAQYGADTPAVARLTGRIAGMGLEMPEGLRSELDVDASVGLVNAPEGARGTINGTITVLRSAYREPLAVVTGLLGALRTERLAAAAIATDSLASRLALDFRVVTDSDIIVDNNIARLALGTDLRVIGTVAAPALAGRAELREGGQLFLGRNVYTINSGTIDFSDPTAIVPELNVAATTRAAGEEIVLTLTGTPETLTPTLSSSNPELGQADLASLLLTGRTLEDVPGDEAQIVGEQILGYLSGDVLGLAGRAIGLDTIRLGGPDAAGLRRDPSAVATETDPTSRLTFGKSIGRDIDLTYSQSLREGSAQTWIVDYQPLSQVNLRLVARDDHLRSYEFRHDLSVGGPERAGVVDRDMRDVDVVAVTLTATAPELEEPLRQVLRLQPGDRFDFAEWQRDRDRLEQRLHADGRHEARVLTTRTEGPEGVALTYTVETGPRTILTVSGYTPSPDTRRRIEEAWGASVFDDFLEEEVEAIVRDALGADGYLEPEVTADVSGTDPRTLAVAVVAGRRAPQRRLAIETDDPALGRDLEQWARTAGVTAWRSAGSVEDALVAQLRGRGYLRAQATAGQPVIEGDAAVLPVRIEAGAVFTISEVTFTGANRVAPARLREAAALANGDPYDVTEIEAARRRVEALYRGDGFAAARATTVAFSEPAGEQVPLAFRIDEGAQQVLREVAVRGNRSIDADIITRALDLDMGVTLPADAWIRARARVFDTGLFRRVDVATEPLAEQASDVERPMRVIVTVEEWPALRLRYGFQLSEERPQDRIEGRDLTPGLSGDLTRRTLFGRAITIGAAAEYQRRERLGRVFVNAPTLLGMRIESLLSAERSRRTFADATFVTDRAGISWEQRTRVGPALQLSYAYRFDRDHTFDTAPPDPLSPSFDVVARIARLTGSAAFDTRDDPTDTRRGSLYSWSLELAPKSLGSQFQFIRQVGQAYDFRPWREVVFASAARVGFVSPRGGQAVLPSELFLAGGARTIRGVRDDSLGPRDIFGDISGGRALLVLNHEVRFPVFGWVRGVGFVDAGNVVETPADLGFRNLVTGIGAGIRLATPFALLRGDVARVVSGDVADRTFRWTFGIGHTF